METLDGALSGVVVIDLSERVAGGYCTRLLAGMGAQVIKIERPGTGDPTRRVPPFLSAQAGLDSSALFQHLNAGKQSITLNLESAQGQALARQLIAQAHIVVENWAAGNSIPLALDCSKRAETHRDLIAVSISDFGLDGLYSDYQSSDLIALALGGMLYTCGDPERQPLALGGRQAEYLAGLNAAVATLAAFYQAQITGAGQHIDISLMESVASALEGTTVAYHRDGTIRSRQGNNHGRTFPMTLLPCKDGYVGVMLANDYDWTLFVQLAGVSELEDSRFTFGEDRLRHRGEIETLLRPFMTERTRHELFRWAQELRLPFSLVLTPVEVLSDSQHEARRFFTQVDHPTLGSVLQVGPPFQMEETPWQAARAPLLGEHTESILRERLGLDEHHIGKLKQGPSAQRDRFVADCAPRNDTPAALAAGRQPLSGIRVLDLTTTWAGPLCTRLLGDLGAEVIKIEASVRPDGTRSDPGLFSWLNWNKRGVTLNLNLPRARECFKRLAEQSDVVVENFSPRVMPNFGLDYSVLRMIRRDLIMLSMPAYGSTGPYANYVAYGPGLEASSGLAALTTYSDGRPRLSGSAYGDPVAGLHGVVAILAALRYRRRTGHGQWIDLGQREALSQMFGEAFVLAAQGMVEPRLGNRSLLMVPQGCYRTRGDEQWIALSVRSDAEWCQLCNVMGKESLADDSRYRTREGRLKHAAALDREIETWTQAQDGDRVLCLLQQVGIAAGVVNDAATLANSPHLASRGFFRRAAATDGRESVFPYLPWKTQNTVTIVPAPRLGEHNREILGGRLGLSDHEIIDLS